ncbi:hypothetical protein I552_7908 [Mycobacterium xenopi 3993]|nr:hypothetical protein I552_7908 [Mycobacterium xenopi 3993]
MRSGRGCRRRCAAPRGGAGDRPWLAGVTGVAAALRERLPEHTFVESADLAAGEVPLAVVFVVSAAAALTPSDCALLDAAAADTDLVIGAVSKIDVHHKWRDMITVDRDALIAHATRYRNVPWVGWPPHPKPASLVSTTWSPRSKSSSPIRTWYDETGCAPGNLGCRRLPAGMSVTPRGWADRPGWPPCAKSARRCCGSDGCRNPSARSRCAAKSSRPASSCPTSHEIAAPRCAANCRRTRPA